MTVRALPPDEFEALVGAHPITEEQRKVTPELSVNRDTFVPALLAVCVFDNKDATEPALSEAEWQQEMKGGSASLGELAGLFNACWTVNDRTPDARLPKGLTQTHS